MRREELVELATETAAELVTTWRINPRNWYDDLPAPAFFAERMIATQLPADILLDAATEAVRQENEREPADPQY